MARALAVVFSVVLHVACGAFAHECNEMGCVGALLLSLVDDDGNPAQVTGELRVLSVPTDKTSRSPAPGS